MEFKPLPYIVPDEKDWGQYTLHLFGNSNAKRVVFFQAGWPDDQSAFHPLAKVLAALGCFCGVACMPEYDIPTARRKQGYTFPEMTKVCAAGLRAFLATRTGNDAFEGADLVLHDWGCVVGTMMANTCPDLKIRKIVLLDVAPPSFAFKGDLAQAFKAHPALGANAIVQLWRLLIQLGYQSALALSFALSRVFKPAGYVVAYLMFPIFCRPLAYLFSPVMPGGAVPRPVTQVSIHFANVYYQFLTGLFYAKLRRYFFRNFVFPPGKPVQFLYGKDNNTFFHTPQTLAHLDASPGCEHKAMDGGHWFYHEKQDATKEVTHFLLGTDSSQKDIGAQL